MPEKFVISIACHDRTGLIAAIAGRLFDAGGNLGETSFTLLAGQAKFDCVCEFRTAIETAPLTEQLLALPELAGAEISVTPVVPEAALGPPGDATHEISVGGGDQPGLIARLCEAMIEFDANIVRLASEPDGEGNYEVKLAVSIPAEKSVACLATVSNTAQGLQLYCYIEET